MKCYTSSVNIQAGALNQAKEVVFEVYGCRIRFWQVERETKCFYMLKRIGYLQAYRLNKKDLGKRDGHRLFTFDKEQAKLICLADVQDAIMYHNNAMAAAAESLDELENYTPIKIGY